MKTKILSLLVLIAIAVASCQKDEADKPAVQQDVSFGIELIDQNGLKTDYACPTGVIATYAHIELKDVNNNVLVFKPQIFFLNSKLYTQAIKLPVGSYELTKFLLMAADETTVVMATPQVPSIYAPYVTKALLDPADRFMIVVPEFQKIEIQIDVLCFELNQANNFGFFWFVIDEIIVREQCFFGDLCIKSKNDYVGSYYNHIFPNLDLYPFDLPAIFKVKLVRDDGWQQEWMNIDINDVNGVLTASNFQAPLCIKYPDRVGIDDVFTATLSILVAQGNGWAFVEFKTWTFTNFMFNELLPNQGQVIDFVVGNCNYDPNADPDWVFPAWINLPTTASINITQTYEYLYWKLVVGSVVPPATNYDILNVGTWASFCGDGNVTINPGGPWNFHIYNTLAYNWVANPMPYANAKLKFEKIHWLINNIGSYGFPAPQGIYITASDFNDTQAKVLQDAVWHIVRDGVKPVNGWATTGHTPNPSLASLELKDAANQFGAGFKPLPGQWSSVLIIKDDNPRTNQLIFAMIDP